MCLLRFSRQGNAAFGVLDHGWDSTVQLPGLYTGTADQVTPLNPNFGYGITTSAQLPMSQQQEVLAGMSGLLSSNNPVVIPPLIQSSGLINPIPYETTEAQLGSGGSSTDPIIFDLSGPRGGKPGETLVAWVLTLPPGKTFARHDRFHIVSQSREHLVEEVNYYPDADNNPIVKDIAYYPGTDNNPGRSECWNGNRSPCTSATAKCLMVKFRAPGLGAHDFDQLLKGHSQEHPLLQGHPQRRRCCDHQRRFVQGENHLHLQRRVRDNKQFRPLPAGLTPANRELMAPGPDGCAAHYQARSSPVCCSRLCRARGQPDRNRYGVRLFE